jgi:hypothetical protein
VAADVPEAAVPPVAAAVAELAAEPAGELLAAPPQPARASPAASTAAAVAVTGNFAAGSGMVFCMSSPFQVHGVGAWNISRSAVRGQFHPVL